MALINTSLQMNDTIHDFKGIFLIIAGPPNWFPTQVTWKQIKEKKEQIISFYLYLINTFSIKKLIISLVCFTAKIKLLTEEIVHYLSSTSGWWFLLCHETESCRPSTTLSKADLRPSIKTFTDSATYTISIFTFYLPYLHAHWCHWSVLQWYV